MRALLLAARPKTLPAAVVPVWVGCCLACHLEGEWVPLLMWGTLLSAVCIQIATNLFNDAIDAEKGADTRQRLGPTRVTSSGLMSKKSVLFCAAGFLVLASCFALILIEARGWSVLLIGIPSLYLSYGYTGGRFPLAYLGLGELFVFLFFGIVATMGTYFVQTGEWRAESALLGVAVGGLSCFLIAINNLRDKEEDQVTGKKTLAVRIGTGLYRRLMVMMAAYTSLAILGVWWWLDLQVGLEIGFIILGWVLLNFVLISKKAEKLNLYLAFSGMLLVMFGVVFQIAVIMGK